MIHEVDAAIRRLLEGEALQDTGVEISFDAPTREWSSKRNSPTVNVFLYDVREDVSRRDVIFQEVRDDNGLVIERRRPPRRFHLRYLITTWTQRTEDEHRLLSALLAGLAKHETIPDELLEGTLADQTVGTLINVALPAQEARGIAEVWTALGGEMRAALDLDVIAPLDTNRPIDIAPAVTAPPRLDVTGPDGIRETQDGRMPETASGQKAVEDAVGSDA